MNRKFSELYTDPQGIDCLFNGPQYSPYELYQDQIQTIFEMEPNYYLNELNVIKKEEEPLEIEYHYETSSIFDSLALILKMPMQTIQLISHENSLAFHKLIDKAKRTIRREKAKLRLKQRCKEEQIVKLLDDVADDKIKLEEQSHDGTQSLNASIPSQDEKSKKKSKFPLKKRSLLVKRKAEKLPKIEDIDQLLFEKESQFGSVTNGNSGEGSLDSDKNQKKIVQMIRNRISAQNSRDRKKAYIQELEKSSLSYEKQNQQLQQKIKDLQSQSENIKKQNFSLSQQLEEVKNKYFTGKDIDLAQSTKTRFGKIGLTLLTLVSVFMMMGKCSQADHTNPTNQKKEPLNNFLFENKFINSLLNIQQINVEEVNACLQNEFPPLIDKQEEFLKVMREFTTRKKIDDQLSKLDTSIQQYSQTELLDMVKDSIEKLKEELSGEKMNIESSEDPIISILEDVCLKLNVQQG